MPLPWQASIYIVQAVMKFDHEIWTLLDWSPGFSRIKLLRQYAPALAGIHPAQAGTPAYFISRLFFNSEARR
jgi:hypothetical protein